MKNRVQILLVIVATGLFLLPKYGMAQSFDVDSRIAGAGFGPAMHFSHKDVNRPAFGANIFFDKGIIDLYPGTITLGGEMSYYLNRHITPDSVNVSGYPSYRATWQSYVLAVRIMYYHNGSHWGISNLHIMGGISIGARYEDFNDYYYPKFISAIAVNGDGGFKVHYTFRAGASYHITPNFAAYATVGYSEIWLNIGVLYTVDLKRLIPRFRI